MMIPLYLTALFIAPQLWIEPFVGLRTDLIIYPLWFATLIARGRFAELFRFHAADWLFLLMVCWIVVTAIVNNQNPRSEEIIFNYVKWFVLYRFLIVSLPSLSSIRVALWWILFFVMILVIEGLDHKFSPDGIGWAGQSLGWVDPSVLADGGTGRTRWINIFDGPGVFCVAYTIGLPVILMLLGRPYGFAMRLLALSMLGPLLLAIYFTGSRGGLLATLGVIGLYLLVRFRVSASNIMLACAVVVTAYTLAPAHLTSVRDENKSAQNRVSMWAEGVEMVQQNPVFGIGKGNYVSYTGKLVAHNSVVEIMGETGAIGLFLWLGLIYTSIKSVQQLRTEHFGEVDQSTATTLLLVLVGYLISAMFVTLEYETLYLILALCAAARTTAAVPMAFGANDIKIVAGLTLAIIFLIKLFVMLYF